jgi:hypothetical protein
MKRMSGKWTVIGAGAVTAAIVVVAAGCFNPVASVDWSEPEAEAVETAAREAAGLGGEEFTLTLRVGEPVDASRSVVGLKAGEIELGKIRNTAQIIAVDAATGEVAAQKLVRKVNDSDPSADLTVSIDLEKGYHFLVLMGHRERIYGGKDPAVEYEYKNEPSTLLAAGFLGDQEIRGSTTLTIIMKPLVVDTVFEYGGVTAPAALGGNELPAGVAARLVWTVNGGYATLRDAQNRTGLPHPAGGISWGALALAERKTILRVPGETAADAVLDGAEYNRITLDLGTPALGTTGSAAFKLEYHPLGQSDTPWIIRNGVNDLAQNGGHGLYREPHTLGRHEERQRGGGFYVGGGRHRPDAPYSPAGGGAGAGNLLLHAPIQRDGEVGEARRQVPRRPLREGDGVHGAGYPDPRGGHGLQQPRAGEPRRGRHAPRRFYRGAAKGGHRLWADLLGQTDTLRRPDLPGSRAGGGAGAGNRLLRRPLYRDGNVDPERQRLPAGHGV